MCVRNVNVNNKHTHYFSQHVLNITTKGWLSMQIDWRNMVNGPPTKMGYIKNDHLLRPMMGYQFQKHTFNQSTPYV